MLLDSLQKVLIQSGKQETGVTYCIWGKHGIGKTGVVSQVAKILNFGFRNMRLSQIDPAELIGYPVKKTMEIRNDDGTVSVISYLDYDPPLWFAEAMRGNYIIFLDELNRAKRDVIQAAFELVNERTLNGRKLPDSVLIIAACNPPSPKYDTIEFDDALVDRFCHVLVKSNYDVFNNWAKTKGKHGKQKISQEILDFLIQDKSRQTFDKTEEADGMFPVNCTPSPRSWEKVSRLFELALPRELRQELIEGVVGPEIAMNFFNSLGKGNNPIHLDDLFKMNINDENDEVIQKIKSYSQSEEDLVKDGGDLQGEDHKVVEMSLLSATVDELINPDNSQFVKENHEKTLVFLNLIPTELSLKALKKLCKDRKEKEFWSKKLLQTKDDPSGVKDKDGNPVQVFVLNKLVESLDAMANSRENSTATVAAVKK